MSSEISSRTRFVPAVLSGRASSGSLASVQVAPDLPEKIPNVLIRRLIKVSVCLGGDQATTRCRAVPAGFRIEGRR